jgi:hypothetical protein
MPFGVSSKRFINMVVWPVKCGLFLEWPRERNYETNKLSRSGRSDARFYCSIDKPENRNKFQSTGSFRDFDLSLLGSVVEAISSRNSSHTLRHKCGLFVFSSKF